MISITNLDFHYPKDPEIKIFEKLSIDVNSGEKVVIIGESGTGKTTLLQIIGNILQPKAGIVKRATLNIAWIFQDSMMVKYLTAEENIRILSGTINEVYFSNLVTTLGIKDLLDKYPSELSLGELQRCAIVRSLLLNADLYLIDEPTASLDEINKQIVLRILFDLPSTLIISTHDPAVMAFTNRIEQIINGKLHLIKNKVG